MTTPKSTDTLEISQANIERQLTAETNDGSLEQRVRVYEIDPVVEKRLRHKLDRRLMSLLFVAYMLAFLDRSNIGNAETADMGKDLGFDDTHYQWLLTIFYIPYSEMMLSRDVNAQPLT